MSHIISQLANKLDQEKQVFKGREEEKLTPRPNHQRGEKENPNGDERVCDRV